MASQKLSDVSGQFQYFIYFILDGDHELSGWIDVIGLLHLINSLTEIKTNESFELLAEMANSQYWESRITYVDLTNKKKGIFGV